MASDDSALVAELKEKYPDVDRFLLEKWERIFTIFFDRNHSHLVDWSDFYLVVRKVRDIYGAESSQMGYARKTMEALFNGLCAAADQNKDKMISLDEWITLLRTAYRETDKAIPKWFDDYQHFMFKLFDVSADGVLDLCEYTDGMASYGFTEKAAHDAFHAFALTDRGEEMKTIDPNRWKSYFTHLFFSTDKKHLGNHLFGLSIA
uniref:EF-hand domain-containing protein n=1 Tax=Rhabditophanes sp. KR3021 TaxID=114890 RepID=A0AC35U6Y3_9BILA